MNESFDLVGIFTMFGKEVLVIGVRSAVACITYVLAFEGEFFA
jgi:hypothetical protein